MKEFTITAIRYALGENLSLDKATQLAERFVSGLKKGQRVMLAAEPRNPTDPNAIAAYINYERVGYVGKEETCEVHPLLDERHQCDGVVERTDGHITFFISIPGASETGTALTGRERILPESPLSGDVRMPFAKDESRLEYSNCLRKGVARLTDGQSRYFSIPEKVYLKDIPPRSVNPDAYQIAVSLERAVTGECSGTYDRRTRSLTMKKYGLPSLIFKALLVSGMEADSLPEESGYDVTFRNISESCFMELNRIFCKTIRAAK